MQTEYTSKNENKFWGHVDKEISDIFYNGTRCWEWMASRQYKGYGEVKWGMRKEKSHRVAWMLTYGEIPDNLWVLHHCDNPPCCNPLHLFLGTHQDNVDDREKKGRNVPPIGEKNGNHKLTDKQVYEIRKLYATGKETYRSISRIFGIDSSYVADIVNYKYRK